MREEEDEGEGEEGRGEEEEEEEGEEGKIRNRNTIRIGTSQEGLRMTPHTDCDMEGGGGGKRKKYPLKITSKDRVGTRSLA